MTKEAALKAFFGGFGIPAYVTTAVPDEAPFPRLDYDVVTGGWMDGELSLTVNLYYYSTDETEANAKARELAEAIGMGGTCLPCDGGCIWLKMGSPWCQNLTDAGDPMIKRRYINVSAEYLTTI